MNYSAIDLLLFVIGGLAIIGYLAAILYAGRLSLLAQDKPPDIPAFIVLAITTISTSLATFLGMALGLEQANNVQGAAAVAVANPELARVLALSWPQSIAAWTYVLSLVLALGIWALCGFGNRAAPIIQELARSSLGLVAGVLVVLLNVRPS